MLARSVPSALGTPPRRLGGATNDFELPAEVQGGEYTLRATAADGQKAERTVIVSAYEPPRLKKKFEFVKKAYGADDTASATVEVRRPTGEALAGKVLSAVITVDGVELPRCRASRSWPWKTPSLQARPDFEEHSCQFERIEPIAPEECPPLQLLGAVVREGVAQTYG